MTMKVDGHEGAYLRSCRWHMGHPVGLQWVERHVSIRMPS